MMNEPCYYRISVKGLVVDETGRFLMVKDDDGWWELPGGGLEHGETAEEGVRREIDEETGLVITYISPAPRYFIAAQHVGKETYAANVIYEVKLKDLDFTPSEECRELRYFSVKEARKVKIRPTMEQFLEVYQID